jgi:hypothetical protein
MNRHRNQHLTAKMGAGAEQRRYGAEFRRIAEFAALPRRAANLGDEVVRLATHGLTSGWVR